MRKGVGDLWRNFQARHRCQPPRTYARSSPLSPNDLALFRAAMAGEHAIRDFGNADITARLYRRPAADRDEAHRRCERVSRLIVKLRGQGLVAKVPRGRRYRVTRYGHRVMAARRGGRDERRCPNRDRVR